MSSDDEFDAVAYKAFEDQLYEEQSSSGLVWEPHVLLSINLVQTCGKSG